MVSYIFPSINNIVAGVCSVRISVLLFSVFLKALSVILHYFVLANYCSIRFAKMLLQLQLNFRISNAYAKFADNCKFAATT